VNAGKVNLPQACFKQGQFFTHSSSNAVLKAVSSKRSYKPSGQRTKLLILIENSGAAPIRLADNLPGQPANRYQRGL
jgi:hypothetical protein